MPDKLSRLKSLSSAKVTSTAKPVQTAESMAAVVEQLKAISTAQQNSQSAITKSIDQLSKVILLASEEGINIDSIVEAINGLKERLEEKNRIPHDYQIDFERDKHGLFKSGIRLSAVSKKLN